MAKFFGCCRFVYNLGLETKIRAYVSAQKNLTCTDLVNQMKDLKDTDAQWLQECSAQALQMALRNLDNAYTAFFKGKGFPRFKNKHGRQSFQLPQDVRVDFTNGTVFLPKLKSVNCVFHRKFKGIIKTATVSKNPSGNYFISILVDNQESLPVKEPVNEASAVGIDMGIKTFATLSDGKVFENIKSLRSNLSRLRVEQRTLARRLKRGKKEQSNGYYRQKLIVARLHERIANQRKDYLQKVSTALVCGYSTLVLEDLNVRGMMANGKLALAIGELGWNSFETMLRYKAEWYGKNLLYIGRFEPSSKTCSTCGSLNQELTLADREWSCKSCSALHDRDLNAAINIRNLGLRNKPESVNVGR